MSFGRVRFLPASESEKPSKTNAHQRNAGTPFIHKPACKQIIADSALLRDTVV